MEITIGAPGILPENRAAGSDGAAKTAGRMTAAREKQATVKVAREFEALFVGMMLKSMRETVGKDKLTGGGNSEEIYRSLLDQEYAKALTEHGGIGLTSMLEQELGKPQGKINYDQTTTKIEVNHENR
jgi:flagellar protein FlgJ